VLTTSSGQVYTFSAYVKPYGYHVLGLRHNDHSTTSSHRVFFNITTGEMVHDTDPSITKAYGSEDCGNGWWRIWMSWTADQATALTLEFQNTIESDPAFAPTATQPNISGTGDEFSGFLLWGAQLEIGWFPTSYISTEASTATRSYDSAYITGVDNSNWFSTDAGTSYVEAAVGGFQTSQGFMSFYQNGYGNDWTGFYSNPPNGLQAAYTGTSYENSYTTSGGSNSVTLGLSGYSPGQFTKMALCWSTTRGTYAQDGSASTNTGNYQVVPYTTLRFDGLYQYGFAAKLVHIKKYAFYQGALDEDEMISLTEE
jgi:hypothetical protein